MSDEPTNPFTPPKSENARLAAAAPPDVAGRPRGGSDRMNHPMISRTMALLVVAFPMGWSMAETGHSDLIRYRSLGHSELLAVLEEGASMGLVGCVATSIGFAGIIFFAVHGLSLGIDRALSALTRRSPGD
jgi:hypothetical protein